VAVIPTPCVQGDMVYATTDYGAKGMLIKLSKSADGIKAEKVYSNKLLENHHGGVILHEGHVYGSHGNANQRKSLPFVCMNVESGKVAWTEEKKVEPSGITFAQGHFYCYGQETGTLVKIAAKSDGFHEVARFKIPRETKNRNPQGAIWTHPVIANGKLYLRDQELLFCFDLSGARAAK
jgi:outer membrane protein assembly factor BamB